MDLLNNIPVGLWQAGAAVLVLLAVYIMATVINKGIDRVLPFVRDLNDDREQLAGERKALFEKQASIFDALTQELKGAMTTQREVFESKLAHLESVHNAEREKWAEQVRQLTEQIQILNERITKLESEGKSKDEEIVALKAQLVAVTAERDAALARLLAGQPDSKPVELKPDTDIAA
jgi:chromosome segregation ATPase